MMGRMMGRMMMGRMMGRTGASGCIERNGGCLEDAANLALHDGFELRIT